MCCPISLDLASFTQISFGQKGSTVGSALLFKFFSGTFRGHGFTARSPYHATWWLIPLSKWVITPVISELTLLIPFISGVITHLLSGMSHQVQKSPFTNQGGIPLQLVGIGGGWHLLLGLAVFRRSHGQWDIPEAMDGAFQVLAMVQLFRT